MKRILTCLAVANVLLMLSTTAFAQNKIVRESVAAYAPGGTATLYALDPLSHSFCFSDGLHGLVVQSNQIRNRCSDLDYNSYYSGSFTSGIEGGRVATIVDLGTASDLKQRYGYQESSLATGQGFVSLRAENGSVVVLKDKDGVQPLLEAPELFAEGKTLANAPVKLGHIYLVRLTDRTDKSFQLLVKFVVVALVPNESVAIRYQVL